MDQFFIRMKIFLSKLFYIKKLHNSDTETIKLDKEIKQ